MQFLHCHAWPTTCLCPSHVLLAEFRLGGNHLYAAKWQTGVSLNEKILIQNSNTLKPLGIHASDFYRYHTIFNAYLAATTSLF